VQGVAQRKEIAPNVAAASTCNTPAIKLGFNHHNTNAPQSPDAASEWINEQCRRQVPHTRAK
jgi:hypothetical protein